MKRIIIIVCLVLIGIVQSKAQVTFRPGVKGGADFSKLTNFNSEFKTGFYVGGQLSIKFNKLYTLQPEIIFSQQGANAKHTTIVPYYDYDPTSIAIESNSKNYSIDYLSFSAINKFYVGNGTRFHLIVGPSLDIKVNDNFDKIYFNSLIGVDFAIIGGFGYSLPNGLSFDVRFKQGMVDIYGNNYNTNIDNNNNGNYDEVVLNQSFQLGLSYSFDLK